MNSKIYLFLECEELEKAFIRKVTRIGYLTSRLNLFLSSKLGIVIVRDKTLLDLRKKDSDLDRASFDLDFLKGLPPGQSDKLLPLLANSKSQLRQDLFVLMELEFKFDGYFVEFGATNGIELSNTYLLEQEFHWRGILVEPAKIWHQDLRRNRQNATIEEVCVWGRSNVQIQFRETRIPELSTIDGLDVNDEHIHLRENGEVYEVQSVSLNDLLKRNDAPNHIDYLSIDTEGSEFEILKNLNFHVYSFSVITCEHNYSENREKINDLLTSHGYYRKYMDISKFDDWYVKVKD